MSNYLFNGFEFQNELEAEFKLQNMMISFANEVQQLNLPLLNRIGDGYIFNVSTPFEEDPNFNFEYKKNNVVNTLLSYNISTETFIFDKNISLKNLYRISYSLDPIDDQDLATKKYVDSELGNSGTVTSIGLTTTTSALTIANTPITTSGDISIDVSTALENFSNLNSTGLLVQDIANTYTTISPGADGEVLTSSLGGFTWSIPGSVNSVDITGSTGLTVLGAPIMDSGTITLTLANNLQYLTDLSTTGLVIKLANNFETKDIPITNGQTLVTDNGGLAWITPVSGGNVSGPPVSNTNYVSVWGNDIGTLLKNTTLLVNSVDESLQVVGDIISASGNLTSAGGTVKTDNITSYTADHIAINKPLKIIDDGSYLDTIINYGYLVNNPSGPTGVISSAQTATISIDCANRVIASEFDAISSKEVKNIIGRDLDIEQEALDLFKSISFTKYKYKDHIKEGNGEYFGVIAEELTNVANHYVNTGNSEFIPNIFCNMSVKKADYGYDLIVPDNMENLSFINIGDKLKLIDKKTYIEVFVSNISAGKISITTDKILGEDIFVYGTYKLCPSVSKNKLFELSCVVLKNIERRLEQLEMLKA